MPEVSVKELERGELNECIHRKAVLEPIREFTVGTSLSQRPRVSHHIPYKLMGSYKNPVLQGKFKMLSIKSTPPDR